MVSFLTLDSFIMADTLLPWTVSLWSKSFHTGQCITGKVSITADCFVTVGSFILVDSFIMVDSFQIGQFIMAVSFLTVDSFIMAVSLSPWTVSLWLIVSYGGQLQH